jgi:lipopolysaccharide transport system permease protein
MPIIYRPEWVPAKLEFVLWLNPFSHLIWCYQDVIYFARIDHPWSWLIMSLLAVFTAAIGWNVFGRLRGLLGNVL